MMGKLEELGWSAFFEDQLTDTERAPGILRARVVEEQKKYYRLACESGEYWAEPQGKLIHAARTRAELPAVGDWVLATIAPGGGRATIHRVLGRRTKFSRKAAGEAEREQIVAANVDVVFVVTSLNQDLNLPRLERYLTVVRLSGARPVLLLTKCDLGTRNEESVEAVSRVAPEVPLHVLSVPKGLGLEHLLAYLEPGKTAAFVGSSGVGKSTLINWLAGDPLQAVGDVREDDDRGRHTTTYRRLIQLRCGLVIDTPGMRELQVWEGEPEDLSAAFADIDELTARCRFANCGHEREPGCAVRAAVESGAIERRRYENFLKLLREAEAATKRKGFAKTRPQDRKKYEPTE